MKASRHILFMASVIALAPVGLLQAENKLSLESTRAFQSDHRKVRIESVVRVNRNNDFRMIVPQKCRTDGEADLYLASKLGHYEDSFVFIPENCVWIEIGIKESLGSVRVETDFLRDITEQFTSISIYHIHVGDSNIFKQFLPAYEDLVSVALINTEYLDNPNYKITHHAVSKFGIIDYGFSDKDSIKKLVSRLIESGLQGYVAQNVSYELSRKKYRSSYIGIARNCDFSVDANEDRIPDCFPITTNAFRLEFRPIEMK